MPNFAIKTPSNVEAIHTNFDDIVNFEIVSKEELYDWIIVPLLSFTGSDDLFLEEVQTEGDINIELINIEEGLDLAEGIQVGDDEASVDLKFKGTNMIMNILFFLILFVIALALILIVMACTSLVIPRCCSCMR